MDRRYALSCRGINVSGGVVAQGRVCLIYKRVLVGLFVSCGIHMNVRLQGFPAEDYNAAT